MWMWYIHALALWFFASECVAEGPWCNAKLWAMCLQVHSRARQAIWVIADKWQISWSVPFVSKRFCQKHVDPALDWTQAAYMFFIGNAFGDFAAMVLKGVPWAMAVLPVLITHTLEESHWDHQDLYHTKILYHVVEETYWLGLARNREY